MSGRQFQKPTVESMIDYKHAIADEAFLEQGKYTLKIL
jgi:hypothetical protein